MKKVICITPGFAAHEQDSTAVPYLQDYFRLLSLRAGVEKIHIVATQYPFTKHAYSWHGISVSPAGGSNKKGLHTLFTFFRTQRLIRDAITNDTCILHAFWLGDAAMSAARMSRKYKLPLLVTLMGQDVKPGNRYVAMMPSHTQYIALSDQQAELFHHHYGKKVTAVIPFPLPDIQLTPGITRSIDLLFVGSYIPIKQPLQFLDIVANIRKQHPGIKAMMVGGGPMKRQMLQRLAELELQQHVVIHDALPREHVFEFMQRSRILIHTSQFEGQCLVYGEALLSGMHVLSFPVGNISNTPKHMVCHSIDEFVLNSMQLLSHPVNFTPLQTVNAQASLDAYVSLYGMQGNNG
jgi:glycosyltransferase involved in cell wall biosynthesis